MAGLPPSRTRRCTAFLLAIVVCALCGSIAQTQFNLAELQALGLPIPAGVRLQTTWRDIYGFGPLYAAVVAVGLLPAFALAGALARGGRSRLPLYLVAGGSAVWAALASANALAGIPVLVFAARVPAGLACLVGGGVLAGAVYALRTR
ncbi:hypothetical protein [Tahibacter sp.]|uniref:hypothetical protein n=1 Tax=Tahibacter sp. TaxID=2056211 RepID=UPI0028C396B9|nr:hypothetical protein [Tahibacter sp.]